MINYKTKSERAKQRRIVLVVSGSLIIIGLFVLALNRSDGDEVRRKTDSYDEYLKRAENSGATFDETFEEIYNSVYIVIGEETYLLSSLMLTKGGDGKVYLVQFGDNGDILRKDAHVDNAIFSCIFKDSTIFYQLYQDGVLDKNGIKDPDRVISMINTWKGGRHDKTKEALAWKMLYQDEGLYTGD